MRNLVRPILSRHTGGNVVDQEVRSAVAVMGQAQIALPLGQIVLRLVYLLPALIIRRQLNVLTEHLGAQQVCPADAGLSVQLLEADFSGNGDLLC